MKQRFSPYRLLIGIFVMLMALQGMSQSMELSEDEEIQLTRKFINAEKERQLGNLEASASLFEQCLKIDPKHDASYFGLGKIYLEQKMYPDAERNFEKAVKLDESNKWYWLSWAQVLLAREKFKEASDIYKEMTKRYPKNPQLQLDYANTLLYAGKSRKAMREFEEFEKVAGPSKEVTRRKYQYYIQKEDFTAAAEEIEKLLDAYPGDNQLYGMLAELYKAQGKIDKAISVYEEARKSDPTNPYIQLSLSEFYDRDGQKDTAYYFLKKAYNNPNLDIDTKVGVLLKMFGEAERYPKVRKQALELCQGVVRTHPDEAKSYSVYGDYLSLDNQRREALEQYKKAVSIDPSRFAIWNQILLIDSELNLNDSLIADSKQAIELFPAQPTVYLFNGIANIQAENYEDAVSSLKTGSQLVLGNNQLSAQLLASLGDAYHELDRTESSDSAYEASLSYDPDNAYVLNNYSYFLSLRGKNLEIAREMSSRSLEIEPDNASYLDTYGWILFQLGEFKESEQFLKRAIDSGGQNSSEVLEHYGDVLFKLGKKSEALDYWKKAKSKGKGSASLDKKIATGTLN